MYLKIQRGNEGGIYWGGFFVRKIIAQLYLSAELIILADKASVNIVQFYDLLTISVPGKWLPREERTEGGSHHSTRSDVLEPVAILLCNRRD